MSNKTLLGISGLLAAALWTSAACHAQKTLLRVDDLLRAPANTAGWSFPLSPRQERYYDTDLEYEDHWFSFSESAPVLLGAMPLVEHRLPPLGPILLRSLLEELSGVESMLLDEGGKYLMVLQQDAAELRRALGTLRASLAAETIRLELRLEEKHGEGWRILSCGHARSVAGSVCRVSDTIARRLHTDFNVEISGSATIGDPEVIRLVGGAALLLRARGVPGRDRAVLELVARQRSFGKHEKLELRSNQLGDLERIALQQSQAALTSVLKRGVAQRITWTADDGRELGLTVKADWSPLAQATARPLLLSSLLQEPVRDVRFGRGALGASQEDDDFVPGSSEQTLLEELLEPELMDEYDNADASSLRALHLSRGDESQRGLVAQLLTRLSEPIPIELDVYSAPALEEPATASSLPATAKRLTSIRTTLLAGRWSSFSGERVRSYVGDWSVEIAGIGGRIGDPEINVISDGYWCELRGSRRSPGGTIDLELQLRLQESDWLEPRLIKMANPKITPGWVKPAVRIPAAREGQGDIYEPEQHAWSVLERAEVGVLERPVSRTKSVPLQLELVPGKQQLHRRSAPRLLPEGQELLIVVRAPGG